jgi:hypothetical protein
MTGPRRHLGGSPPSGSTAVASAGLAMGVPPAEASEYDEPAR